jgi:hypothetical protein
LIFLTLIGAVGLVAAVLTPIAWLFGFWFNRSGGDWKTGFLPWAACVVLYVAALAQIAVWTAA